MTKPINVHGQGRIAAIFDGAAASVATALPGAQLGKVIVENKHESVQRSQLIKNDTYKVRITMYVERR